MKRLIALGLTILTCGAAYALPLGNPSEASLMCDGLFVEGLCADFCDPCVSWCDAVSFRVGFYGDYVFNRHLDVNSGISKGSDIEHFELYTNAGYLALNAWDRIDIFATLGATNLYINTSRDSLKNANPQPNDTGYRVDVETETGFSWSIGARGTLYECGCCSFGIEGQYFYTDPDIRRVSSIERSAEYTDDFLKMKYQEWQIGIGIAYRIWNFVPYFGAKWSHVHVDMGKGLTSFTDPTRNIILEDLRNAFHGGYVLGVSIVDCEKASLTVEARYPDEKAVYVNGQFRF